MNGMTERRYYQLRKRREAPGVQLWGVAIGEKPGARGGFYLAGQGYSGHDAAYVVAWVTERAAGYPRRLSLELVRGALDPGCL